jgi:hypothetical protein
MKTELLLNLEKELEQKERALRYTLKNLVNIYEAIEVLKEEIVLEQLDIKNKG